MQDWNKNQQPQHENQPEAERVIIIILRNCCVQSEKSWVPTWTWTARGLLNGIKSRVFENKEPHLGKCICRREAKHPTPEVGSSASGHLASWQQVQRVRVGPVTIQTAESACWYCVFWRFSRWGNEKKVPQVKAEPLHHKAVTSRKDKHDWVLGGPQVNLIYLQTAEGPGDWALGRFHWRESLGGGSLTFIWIFVQIYWTFAPCQRCGGIWRSFRWTSARGRHLLRVVKVMVGKLLKP